MRAKAKILMIDHDPRIQTEICPYLADRQFAVQLIRSARVGLLDLNLEPFDIIVVDHAVSGYSHELCLQLRGKTTIPIIYYSAIDDEVEKVLALESGADDYLVKYINPKEFHLRILAKLRRVELEKRAFKHQRDAGGKLEVHLDAVKVYKNKQLIPMTLTEVKLLSYFIEREGQVVTHEELINAVWGRGFGTLRSVYSSIRWLREKIEDDPSRPQYIKTRHKLGYSFLNQAG